MCASDARGKDTNKNPNRQAIRRLFSNNISIRSYRRLISSIGKVRQLKSFFNALSMKSLLSGVLQLGNTSYGSYPMLYYPYHRCRIS